MIELIVLNYLKEKMDIPVALEKQEATKGNYVYLEKLGSGKSNHILNATIAIQSYGKSLYVAAELNERIKSLMDKMIELDAVSRVTLNSDYNFTNNETKEYRYQAVFDIYYL